MQTLSNRANHLDLYLYADRPDHDPQNVATILKHFKKNAKIGMRLGLSMCKRPHILHGYSMSLEKGEKGLFLAKEMHYKYGQRHGRVATFNENGVMTHVEIYKKGHLNQDSTLRLQQAFAAMSDTARAAYQRPNLPVAFLL